MYSDHVKIYLDDVRNPPDGFLLVRSVNEAISLILECEEAGVSIDIIDIDHDLGDFYDDGGDGIKLLDWLVERGTLYNIRIHTANIVGRQNMMRIIRRFW